MISDEWFEQTREAQQGRKPSYEMMMKKLSVLEHDTLPVGPPHGPIFALARSTCQLAVVVGQAQLIFSFLFRGIRMVTMFLFGD